MSKKPKPIPTRETLPYWEGGAHGELRYSWCPSCSRALFPPRGLCGCGSHTEWRISSPSGTIYSFTIVERAPLASFRHDVPYAIALVELSAGFRIMTNIRGGTPAIGMPVRIVFEPLDGGLFLPQAQLESSNG